MYKHLPWKKIITRAARSRGFVDPINILTRLEKFAQPSEIAEPIELLRAGAEFHARGLMNTKAIQHNLDWVWPYWVHSQFNPRDKAFLPRAFSITHVNLTHRNWTAVGIPGCNALPIVDPRGLITPFFDGWSLDAWIVNENNHSLLPSRLSQISQFLTFKDELLKVLTRSSNRYGELSSEVWVNLRDNVPICSIKVSGFSPVRGRLVVSLRPFNPEGVSFVHDIELDRKNLQWKVDGKRCIHFGSEMDGHIASDYQSGDVFLNLLERSEEDQVNCEVGMATAAVTYKLEPNCKREIQIDVNLNHDDKSTPIFPQNSTPRKWSEVLDGLAQLRVPNEHFMSLFATAKRTVILHSPKDVYPGPYTYKRFWFRDACIIIHSMLCAGMIKRAEAVLDDFKLRQTTAGYFHSQEGEWDSNGQVLWVLKRYCQVTQTEPKRKWHSMIRKAAKWIINKRLNNHADEFHAGLMPSGFSAEHLGPIDFYYWDNFWSVEGLRSAEMMAHGWGSSKEREAFNQESKKLLEAIVQSLERSKHVRKHAGIPASPYRRMDAGAIGSIVAGYPLQILPANDESLLRTTDFLLENCFIDKAFFQEITHSGFNAYLTLHIAQVLLRAGDARFLDLVKKVATLASTTGQWPEAIHPHTLGGCMGDGQHVWAAAEWILMIRNMFVREEEDRLVIGSGIPREWLHQSEEISFGPAPTSFGTISIFITTNKEKIYVSWQFEQTPESVQLEIRIPEHKAKIVDNPEITEVELEPVPSCLPR